MPTIKEITDAKQTTETAITPEQAIQDAINAARANGTEYAIFSAYLKTLIEAEQRGALELKFLALAPESQSTMNVTFPQLKTYERYVVRQLRKEANGKLASNKRPEWQNTVNNNAAWLLSADDSLQKTGRNALLHLAEEIDAKESATCLKKYLVKYLLSGSQRTKDDKHIVELCGIFGIDPSTLK